MKNQTIINIALALLLVFNLLAMLGIANSVAVLQLHDEQNLAIFEAQAELNKSTGIVLNKQEELNTQRGAEMDKVIEAISLLTDRVIGR